ncbi:MAG TPA: aminopeptidase P N-terminal domain-containing protein [Pirellulaceae bacterium]|nr:aminopeptidase P N-terminal domain-containing protein [Pirellulaceae bacterium]
MKSVTIKPELFVTNRDRLRQKLLTNSLVVVSANDVLPTNADGTMEFHQNADLFWLTGINQEETILVMAPDAFDEKQREILFLREASENLVIWEGHKLTKEQASQVSGIKQVKWLGEFPRTLHKLMCESENVYLNTNEHGGAPLDFESRELRFARQCQRQYPLHRYHRLARLMHELRVAKSTLEVELIKQACSITGLGFSRILKFIRPGVNEAEIEAELAHEFIRHKATFAYSPIIGSGANNCILHYNQNDQVCKKGDLVLLDVAAGYGQYASDLTRTVPVSGKFSRRQKQVYNAVLRVFRQTVAEMKPGKLLRDLRKDTESMIEKELLELDLLKPSDIKKQDKENPAFKKYFMHGVSHPLGLDVHDVGFASQPIAPGWVLTCEPAIYIKDEGFGIRLENDILITADGNIDLMEDIPIEAEEIEVLMGGRD